jgi:gamma-glutamylcyclotransferase (GGCT)/AIG2-like uncharacterized protein YtfP
VTPPGYHPRDVEAVRYFAYGSNIEPGFIHERCPSATNPVVGRLDGFRLEFNVYSDVWGGGAANLELDPDAHVWGVVWEVDRGDLAGLDTFQGHPTYYRHEDVVVVCGEELVTCTTFRVAHLTGFVRPTDDYLERVRSGMAQLGLPEEALEILERAARPPTPRIST